MNGLNRLTGLELLQVFRLVLIYQARREPLNMVTMMTLATVEDTLSRVGLLMPLSLAA